jgi:UDP-N-acetylmuramoylalanine--D-glutamate ligase
MKRNWAGLKVLIVGAARQGLALARFLSERGATVTLNDQREPEQMQAAAQLLSGFNIHWALGGHPLELLDGKELVCISGGVPLDLPIVAEALRRGMPLINDSQIFMEAVQAPVIGITGSAGKTTTTTLVGRMAEAYAHETGYKAWVGGNIGWPLVEHIDEIQPEDLVVFEFSSFQLELMTVSPQVAAVLNVTPNHLDRHGTLEAYTAAKARILDFQSESELAILCREDEGSWSLRDHVRGKLASFGFEKPEAGDGSFVEGDHICFSSGGETAQIMPVDSVRLRGRHNLLNVLAACAIACAAGFPAEVIQAGVRDFEGVAHRLEFVRSLRGAAWYNDSIATAPERTIAAIQAFEEPLILLLGGRDKNLPWSKLAELAHRRIRHIVVFGEAAEKILQAIGPVKPGEGLQSIQRQAGLQEAVQAAADLAQPGDVVLLAPGGTSYDQFIDFEERGERFREWVKALS